MKHPSSFSQSKRKKWRSVCSLHTSILIVDGSEEIGASQALVEEWEWDVRQSVNDMFDRSETNFQNVFEVWIMQ